MSKRFKTVSALQDHLKQSILEAIENKIIDICMKVAQKHIEERVYEAYTPQGDFAYDRTFELLNSVTVGNLNVGTKYVTFEIYMDTEKINPYVRNSFDGYHGWNAHADVYGIDVSEYIPLWIEEGTNGSLFDREGAHYMEQTHFELDSGKLARELANALRQQGWCVIEVS
jgi:hypothetical protein